MRPWRSPILRRSRGRSRSSSPPTTTSGAWGTRSGSIVAQTLSPAEIVVADDGSDDGTERFVQEFAARDAGGVPFRYLRLPSRSGVVAARNAGIEVARGEWIATCDSDDVWAPGKLEKQIAFVRDWQGSRRIALVGTHGYNMNDAKTVISPAIMGPTSEEDYDALSADRGATLLRDPLLGAVLPVPTTRPWAATRPSTGPRMTFTSSARWPAGRRVEPARAAGLLPQALRLGATRPLLGSAGRRAAPDRERTPAGGGRAGAERAAVRREARCGAVVGGG